MKAFDYQPQTRIVFGTDKLDALGALAASLTTGRVLVVSDKGVVAAGHTERGIRSLQAAGLEPFLFQDVHENPTTADVEAGLLFTQTIEPDLIIGLGGGSAMDCAKGINFVFSCGGKMQDYWGVGKATRPMLPMIAVPTTAGTGSEAQSFALITDAQSHVKMACGDKKAAFRIALLDPQLTLTQPPQVTAVTGIDAIAHALETYVSTRRNPVSLGYSREAWRQLSGSFSRVLADPSDLEARSGMQLGACFAGLAIENSMLGAAHALANPLTARYGIIHGQAVALMLPAVIRYNGGEVGAWYRELLDLAGGADECPSPEDASSTLAEFVAKLVRQAGLASRLADVDVNQADLPALADQAAQQWTGTFNPRKVTQKELLQLYEVTY